MPPKRTIHLLICVSFFAALAAGCATTKTVNSSGEKLIGRGIASWYGPKFNGKYTANGERYNQYAMTAAHKTLPFDTYVRVVDVDNGRSCIVRINDRGPYAKGRIIDLSKRAAQKLGMIGPGTAHVLLYLVRGNPQDVYASQQANSGSELYTVQIASFQSKADAEEKASHFRASWIDEATVNGKKVYRVYLDHFKSKAEAERALQEMETENINGFVKEVQN